MGKFVKKQVTYYAVRVGKKTGVFDSWITTKEQIQGVSKPDYKKFNSYQEAVNYLGCRNIPVMYERVLKNGITNWTPRQPPKIFQKSPYSIWIFTDGSCKQNNNVANIPVSNPAGWGVVILKCLHMNDTNLSNIQIKKSIKL